MCLNIKNVCSSTCKKCGLLCSVNKNAEQVNKNVYAINPLPITANAVIQAYEKFKPASLLAETPFR
jgi:hypothetical protein